MKNHVKAGNATTMTAPSGGVSSGELVFSGSMFGVAATDAAEGEDFELVHGEVWELPKTSAQAWTLGAKVYWDSDDSVATTTSTDNTLIGVAAAAAANPSGTGIVRLNASF
jgi:predicted RecA/RadA family phage recombinase